MPTHAPTALRDTPIWRNPSRDYLPELDGLRALAIIPVIGIHVNLVGGGFVGVAVFFCLSGYLIGSLLLKERASTGTIRMKEFYIRRLGRLYPALIAMVLIAVPIAIVTHRADKLGAVVAALLAATYTANLYSSVTGIWLPVMNPAWTLAQEEQFYLVAPWFLRWTSPGRYVRTIKVLSAVVVTVVIARLAAGLLIPEAWQFTYENPLLNLDAMLLGTVLAIAVAKGVVPTWLKQFGSSRLGVLLAVGLIVLSVLFADIHGWRWAAGLTATTFATSLLLVRIAAGGGRLNRVLRAAPAVWVGRRSYGIYLYHYPVLTLTGATSSHPLPDLVLRTVIGVLLSVAAAEISARCLETPVRNWIRRRSVAPTPAHAEATAAA